MAIELPRRSNAPPSRRGAVRLPTAGDVPRVPVQRDPGVRVPAGAFGEQTGAALVDVGQAIGQLGGTLADISQQLAAKKRRAQVASSTAEAGAALQSYSLDLESDPDWETYNDRFEQRSQEIFDQHSQGLDAEGLAQFTERFQRLQLESAYRVKRLGTARAADAGVADLNTALDGYASLAGRAASPEEFDFAFAMAREDIDRAAQDGFITEEAGQRAYQRFTEQADSVAARQLILENPAAAVKALSNPDAFPHLDEGQRVSLLGAAQQDIEREAARREAAAGRDVADAVWLLNRGRVPDNLSSVQSAAQGTRYEADLNAAIQNRAAVEEFMRLPLPEQGRQLRGIDRQAATTRTEVERQDALAKAYASSVTLLNQGNGLAAASQAGAITDPVPLDFANPASLAARGEQAQVASRWAGQPVSPLLDSEADALAASIDQANPGEVVGLLRGLHDGLGEEQAGLLAGQIAPKRPELAAALSLVPYQPMTARDIVTGGRALRENPELKPSKTDRLPAVESVYQNLFTADSAGAMAAYQEAATALYAARRIASGETSYDADAYEQALRDVAGGPVEWRGRNILPPVPGMDESAVEDVLDGLTDDDLAKFGNGAPVYADGSAFTVEDFDRGLFRTDAQLVSSGPGRYLIFAPGLGYVQSASGGAYELNLGAKLR